MKIKKLISILCCAAMLIGLVPATVFAAAPGVYDLAAYGQQTVTLPTKQTMPTVNGKIEANEYAWSYTVSLTEDDPDDGVRIEIADGLDTSEASEITYHMSSDSENVYFGISLVDTTYRVNEFFYLQLDAGNDYSKHMRYYIPMGTNKAEMLTKPAGAVNTDYYVSSVCSGQTVDGRNEYHSEIQIARSQLETHFGIENLDTLLVAMTQRYVYNSGNALATWGIFDLNIQRAGLAPTTTMTGGTYIYPHVVNLADTWVPNAFELSEYEQATVTIPEKKDMPTVDGTVNENEYAWSYSVDVSNIGAANQAFITDTNNVNNGETTNVTYYMSSDSQNVYFAVTTEDTAYRTGEFLYLQIDATSDLSKQMRYYVPIGSKNAELLNKPSGTANTSYYEENCSLYKVDGEGNTTGYHTEIKISRETLENYFGVENLDTILVSMSQRCTYIEGSGSANVTWGFYSVPLMNAGLKVPATMNGGAPYAYPHVVKLADTAIDLSDPYKYGALGQQTVTIPQSASMPTANGTITAGEYAWSYEADFANDTTDDNFFLTGTNVTNADKATKVTYYMSSDSDSVYFGIDLDDMKAEGTDALYLQITAGDDLSKYVQYYVKIGGIEMTANTLGLDKANVANYYKTTGSTYTITDSVRVGSQHEVSIGRDQLKDMFGVDSLDKLLVSMTYRYQYVDGEGNAFAIWGFDNEKLTDAGVAKHPTGSVYPNVVILADSLINVPKDPYGLSEFGQKTETLTSYTSPFVDGSIDEGEYEKEIEAILANDESDDNFYIYGNPAITDTEKVNFYISADDENIYIAAKQKDPTRRGTEDMFYVQIGASATNSYLQYYIPYMGSVEVIGKEKATWGDYYYLYATKLLVGETSYEIAIPKSVIMGEFGVDSLDKVLLTLSLYDHVDAETSSRAVVTWGFESAVISGTHTAQGYPVYGYPHVLDLYEAPAEELPELPETPTPECTHDFGEWTVNGEGTLATRVCSECDAVQTSDEFSYSGSCGDGLVWMIDKKTATLTVVGNGAMLDFTYENDAPWYAYRANIGSVVIEEGVTSVGDYAFWSHYPIKNVTLANSVTYIGKNAFCGAKIEVIELPEGLETIGDLAFQGTALTEIEIPSTVTSIGANPFLGCDLETITVAEGNTAYTSADNCIVEAGTVILGTKNSTIPADATGISYMAFARTAIATVNVPASVENIDSTAFAFCESLTAITVDAENAYYRMDGNCLINTAANTVIKGFSDSVIPEGVTAIEKLAFAGSAIENVTVPDGVETIGALAFAYCDSLKTVELPASITSIDEAVFMNSALETLNYAGTETEWNEVAKAEGWNYEAGEFEVVCHGVEACTHTNTSTTQENRTESTCKVQGSYVSVVTCNECGAEISRTTVTLPIASHTEGEAVTENEVASTCKTEGSYDSVVYCTVCNSELSRTKKTIPTKPHTEETIPAVAATCTKTGLTEGVECSVCDTVLVAQKTTKKLDHTYETATDLGDGLHRFTCTVCSTTKNDRHNFAKDANTCTECGAEKEHRFDGARHEYVGAPVTEAPTLEGDSFDETKYTAKVEDVKWDSVGGENQALYAAHDDNMLYIAVEIDKSAYDVMTSLILKVIASDGAELETAITALSGTNYKVYVDEANGKVTVAINVDRSALALVNNASTGNSSEDMYLVLVTLDGESKELLIDTSEEGDSFVTIEDQGETSLDISGSYVKVEAEKVISVALSWEGATFIYSAELEWNADEYQNDVKEGTGKWTTDPMTITVTNHSNQGIEAAFAFTETVDGVTGKFTAAAVADGDDANDTVNMDEIVAAETVSTIELASAAPGEGETTGSEKTDTVYFYVTGGELSDSHSTADNIGNITITISAN